jgi:HTH-type transcriptional regulator / antitoxin HigA
MKVQLEVNMADQKTNHYIPPPGEFIREEMKAKGWTQDDLARILGRPLPTINRILLGKHAILPEMAIALGAAFNVAPEVWMSREAAYRLSLTVEGGLDVQRRARLYELAPVKDMEKRGWIRKVNDIQSLEYELQKFFGMSSLDQPIEFLVSLRTASHAKRLTPPQLAWCFRARQLASNLIVKPFISERLIAAQTELRKLAAYRSEASRISEVLGNFGIRFVIVECLPGAKIDGAAFWINESPTIALSLRYDRHDYFWFTLIHEFMHIVNNDSSVDDDLGREGHVPTVLKDDSEKRADIQAAELLVHDSDLESFIHRVGPLYSKNRIVQFAHSVKMHPSVIVGQLQNRGEIGWDSLCELLTKIRDNVIDTALTDGWGHIVAVEPV